MFEGFDRLDVIVLGGAVLFMFAFYLVLGFLAYRKPRGPGERLARQGAGRVILRAFTRGGDSARWN